MENPDRRKKTPRFARTGGANERTIWWQANGTDCQSVGMKEDERLID